MSNPIADIHLHSSLKPFGCSEHPDYRDKTMWDAYPEQQAAFDKLHPLIRSSIKDMARSSQAHLDACIEGGIRAPFLALYPIEREMFALRPRKPFKWLFDLILPAKDRLYLGMAVTGFPENRVQPSLSQGSDDLDNDVNYFEEFLAERNFLIRQTRAQSVKYPEKQFRIATNYEEFVAFLSDEHTIAGILTLEGGHALGHYPRQSILQKEYHALAKTEIHALKRSFSENIHQVKTEKGGRFAPLFVTLAHHYNNLLMGHARSFSDRSAIVGRWKRPSTPGMRYLLDQEVGLNKGFTDLGRSVVEQMLDRQTGRRILIDTKHMSIDTRREFYALIRKKRAMGDAIPIIHSHGAVSGCSTLDRAQKNVDVHGIDKGKYFSRWQINLTDEDILETYDSDGLIGIILNEARMPGDEFKSRIKKLKKKIKRARSGSAKYKKLQKELHAMYLQLIWSNIFHIVKTIAEHRSEAGEQADGWSLIALGSDYDGLINPFNGYTKADTFSQLKADLLTYLNNGGDILYADDGEGLLLSPERVTQLKFGRSVEECLDAVFFDNVDHFLSKYFTTDFLDHHPIETQEPMMEPAMIVVPQKR